MRSDDPQYPVGYSAVGDVDIVPFRVEGALYAEFIWSSQEPMEHYAYGPRVIPRVDDSVLLPGRRVIGIERIDSCPPYRHWSESVENRALGIGTLLRAEIGMEIERRVSAPSGLCDPPPRGRYDRSVRIVVVADRPGPFCSTDADCASGMRCNAWEACLPHPICYLDRGCDDVCTGWCES